MTPNSHTQSRPQATNFLSSRAFVRTFDNWARDYLPGYSRRSFARWAKVESPNFLTLVIQGKRPLQGKWLKGFTKAAHLPPVERDYIKTLCELETEKDDGARDTLVNRLYLIGREGSATLSGSRLELLTNPFAWTLYYLIQLRGQDGSLRWFKSRLREKLTIPQIREALLLLRRLSLIEEISQGVYQTAEVRLESSDQILSAENSRFHEHVLTEALKQLKHLPVKDRAFGSLTITVPHEREAEFRAEVNKVGRSLAKKYAHEESVEGNLYRFNIQSYPLTETT